MSPVIPPHPRWDLIRQERIRCGFATVKACATAASINPQRLAGLEGGSMKDPTAVELAKLAMLGFDLKYILTGERALSHDEQALVDNYRGADSSGQKALRQVGIALAQPLRGSEAGIGG